MLAPLDPKIASELASLGLMIATRVDDVVDHLELVKETWSERAAIREYLGGQPRWQAESYAVQDVCVMLGIRYK